tara:strand:- start:869 stop:1066 length:198 start_codon:yes stop_codon:yes gene_type:complete
MDDCPRCQQSEQYGCGCTTLEISKWRADEIERLRTELTDEIEQLRAELADEIEQLSWPTKLKEPS